MRNFLAVTVLFLAACNSAPVENSNDSTAIDSMAVMTDTTLPHPQSTLLDTVAQTSKPALIKDSASIAAAMAKNTSDGWSILDTMTGDLNRDAYADLLMVLQNDGKFVADDEPRPLLILIGTASGELKLAEENDSVVFCEGCGGIWGDPYEGLAIKNGYFSVEHYGGSSERWSRIITFKYNEEQKTWLLHRDGGINYSVFDPDNETEYFENQDQYGKLKFVGYNYN